MTMEYERVFCDVLPPLTDKQARHEASRCYYCYDAPCIQACPTGIDIPSFIRKIGNGNARGAALDILGANILGGTCARVCPVETLCQQACVREKAESKPVEIGRLQRFATDAFFESGEQPFPREKPNQKSVAIIGAGPAGLSCAHALARLGYEITIFERREKPGGLNEYGLAPYKVPGGFVQKEIDFVLRIGGIKLELGQGLGRDFELEDLRGKYSAVFLGVGLGSVNRLGIPGEDLPGVMDAVKQIALIRQTRDLAKIPVGRDVVVIGGGNTAIDIAIQMKRLGAEFVTLAYRRGCEQMGATHHEQELAKSNGVLIKPFVRPVAVLGEKFATRVQFEYTELGPDQKLKGSGRFLELAADQVFKAIGQALEPLSPALKTERSKLGVNASFATSVPGVFAGGDCVGPGEDLTVTAVQQGKLAAREIHESLKGAKNG